MKHLLCLFLAVLMLGMTGCAAASGKSVPAAPESDFTSAPPVSSEAAPESAETAAPVQRAEKRAMWVSYLEWPMLARENENAFTASARSLLDNCASLGLDTVIVQVRPFSDAVYISTLFPWSHLVTGAQGAAPGYDPLEILVREAHARGLLLEAWVNPYRIRLNDNMPAGELSPDHPAVLHPDWVREANGGLYFDPALPEVQQLVADGAAELAQNYEIDGIQFDDYFYPTTDPEFDAGSYALYGNGLPLDEWRRGNVNSLVKKVYDTVRGVNPELTFGISPQGNNDNNYYQQYSDVGLWLSTPGYVDYIMPQVYWGFDFRLKNGSDRFAFGNLTDEWLAMPRDPSVSLYFGLGAYRIGAGDGSSQESDEWHSGHNLADMAAMLRAKGADGYALYRYEHLFCGGETAALQNEERTALAAFNGAA